MPVNPDAYMSGAIPSLSRGGSWQNLPDAQAAALDSMSFASPGPGGSIYPRPSQIAPPSPGTAGTGMGNRTNIHFGRHPWAMNPALPHSPLLQQYASSYAPPHAPPSASAMSQYHTARDGSLSSQGGSMMSGRAPAEESTRHLGCSAMPGNYHSPPASLTSYVPSVTPPRSAARPSLPSSVPATPQPYYPSFSPNAGSRSPQQEWEWASGSPKPMTPGPDYFAARHVHAESQFTLSQSAISLRLPSPRKKSTTSSITTQPLPPPPQSGRLRLDAHPERAQRPAPTRRHTERYVTSIDEAQREMSASRSHPKSLKQRRLHPESPYIALVISVESEASYAPIKSASTPKAHPTHDSAPRGEARSQSARQPGIRQSSHLRPIPSPSSNSGLKAVSLAERRLKQGSAGRPSLPTIISAGSTIDFTSSQSVTSRTATKDPYGLTELRDSLPPIRTDAYSANQPPLGEVSDYDRYTAHPAVPSEGSDHDLQAHKPTLRMDLKHIPAADYRPPCFPPAPNNKLKWNREGPAMKTHGIAWMRDAPDGPLPTGPQGPRWAQARPPNLDLPQDGNWWESGVG